MRAGPSENIGLRSNRYVVKDVEIRFNRKSDARQAGGKKRVDDFNEIYDEFDGSEAETQASRCSQCGVPFVR